MDGKHFFPVFYFILQIVICSSLKTEENLQTVKKLPSDKILLETDCPWCEIRPSHAGYKYVKEESRRPSIDKRRWKAECMVKGRNEPANIW